MPESSIHNSLVIAMSNWIAINYCDGDHGSILVDKPENTLESKPPKIFGYIPDVYAKGCSICGLIVGEAKTAKDIERTHTEHQIKAYLEHCKLVDDAVFVIAVPWHMTRCAKSLIVTIRIESKPMVFTLKLLTSYQVNNRSKQYAKDKTNKRTCT